MPATTGTALDTWVSIAILISPIVVAIGFYFLHKQWESVRNARTAQLIVSLAERWDTEEMARARQAVNLSGRNLKKDFDKADKKNDIEAYTDYVRVANFFDELGLLVTLGFLKCSIAWEVWGKTERNYYRFYDTIINSQENRGYFSKFIELNKLFTNEEACGLKNTKSQHAP